MRESKFAAGAPLANPIDETTPEAQWTEVTVTADTGDAAAGYAQPSLRFSHGCIDFDDLRIVRGAP